MAYGPLGQGWHRGIRVNRGRIPNQGSLCGEPCRDIARAWLEKSVRHFMKRLGYGETRNDYTEDS